VIAWLVAVPLAAAIVVAVLRELPLLAAPIAASSMLATAIVALSEASSEALLILGRSASITPNERVGVAYCCLLLAILFLYGYRVPQGQLAPAFVLASVAGFIASVLISNLSISGLLLEIAVILAILTIPDRPDRALTIMRAAVMLVIACSLLLFAAWAQESRSPEGGTVATVQFAALAALVGFALLLGASPFHGWLPGILRGGSALSTCLLAVILSSVALLNGEALFDALVGGWEGETMLSLLTIAGLASVSIGALGAAVQRSVTGALAYAAIADTGFALSAAAAGIDLGMGGMLSLLALRGLCVVAVAMGAGILQMSQGSDDIESLRGCGRNAPLTVAGTALGLLALSGAPPSVSFHVRVAVVRELARTNSLWIVAYVASAAAVLWAAARLLCAAYSPVQPATQRREPPMPALLTLGMSAVLVLAAFVPGPVLRQAAAQLLPMLSP